MDPDDYELRQRLICQCKNRWPTKKKAKLAAQQARVIHGVATRHYRCKFCGSYHLTTNKRFYYGRRRFLTTD